MANTIDLTFLGTSSAQPSVTRSHSSLALRINGTIWLFDAGEGIQRQLMYSTLKLGKINKVFITHLHGDHIYGLPGLVCTLTGALNPQNHMENNDKSDGNSSSHGSNNEEMDMMAFSKDPQTTPCLEIYGPEGLRNYLRSALMFTYSRLPIYYRVHELILPKDEAEEIAKVYAKDKEKEEFVGKRKEFKKQIKNDLLHPDELMGEDIEPDADGYFRDLLSIEGKNVTEKKNKSKKLKTNPIQDKVRVSASYIKHSVPTLGYVIEEHDLHGNVKTELVKPVLMRNKEALGKLGIKQPLSLIRDLKNGKVVELPDGSVIRPEEVITPTEHRKIVILGDTYNPSKIIPLAENPTILVHEATNMYEGIEDGSEEALQAAEAYRQKVMSRGHSTPEMAGAFASRLHASTLILNHFSSRYASLNHIGMIQPGWNEKKVQKVHRYHELKTELRRLSQELGYPYPQSPSKRDLLSEQEKQQLKMKDKPLGKLKKNKDPKNEVEIEEGVEVEMEERNDEDEDGVLTFAQQKLLNDWETMEKIRSKAASTFAPEHPERIILADDFLQVECNRPKAHRARDKNKSKEEEEEEEVNKNEPITESHNTPTNEENEEKRDWCEDSTEKEKTPSSHDLSSSIPVYMAWNQVLI